MKIEIFDRTLCRDDRTFSFKEKIEIARQLEKLKVDTVEIGEIDNIKRDTLLVRTVASFVKDAVLSVAGGFSKEEIDNAVNALNTAKKPRIRIELPVSTVGMEYTCHKKAPKMLEYIKELVGYASEKCSDVEFCAVDATRAETDFLKEVIATAYSAGAKIVTICDTAAEMLPDSFGEFIKELKTDGEIGIMCDNKNGLAVADAVIAIKNGANIIKTSVGGSDIPLGTFASVIKNCGNSCSIESGIKITESGRIIKQIGWITDNVKNEKTAVLTAQEENGMELDANDDSDTVLSAVMKLGYDLSEEDSAKVYEEFLRVASKRKVTLTELDAIVATVALQVPPTYKLVNYVVNSSNVITSSAQITLQKNGENLQGISIGDGPIDAAFLALEQITGTHFELDDFQIHSVTQGKEAMGNALVKLRKEGKLYSGNGISTDIISASIKAYINAVNKIVYEEA
ncbi:MAG: alpha-isopropylmalate synthase regulatory domain-containing protein [Acutalibacteraceae bacterium]|nr:alpha-isopropylmalate synthase regulatory domain-containing protein [Acutalibacteraceae bacterium]